MQGSIGLGVPLALAFAMVVVGTLVAVFRLLRVMRRIDRLQKSRLALALSRAPRELERLAAALPKVERLLRELRRPPF